MIGKRLRDLREDADLTQSELAKILNINKHSISSYERDKSEPPDDINKLNDIKIKIVEYFNISSDYLLGIINEPIPIKESNSIIRLPFKFSSKAKRELLDYINYLASKYKLT